MAKKRKKKPEAASAAPSGPAQAAMEALLEGDNQRARRLAADIEAREDADESQREAAAEIRTSTGIERGAMAFLVGGLLLWLLVFVLGVALRH